MLVASVEGGSIVPEESKTEGTSMDPLSVAALVVAIISALVAIWQGMLSRRQLDLAKETEGRTAAALDEIRRVTAETRQTTNEVKQNIDERITKILDSKLLAEQQSTAQSQQFGNMFMEKLMEGLGGNPPAQPPA